MSVFDQYIRLESTGLWREYPGAPPREVLLQFGNSTLVLTGFDERALGHWALAGIQIISQTNRLTTYSMTGDGAETLTVSDPDMIAALGSVIRATPDLDHADDRRRRRIPWAGILVTCLLAGGFLWFAPGVVRDQAIRMVPQETAIELGDRMLLTLMESGTALCTDPKGQRALDRIADRLAGDTPAPRLRVVELSDIPVFSLPGPTVLLSSTTLAEAQGTDELAGWIQLGLNRDPVGSLMTDLGFAGDIRYILTGEVEIETLAAATGTLLRPPSEAEASAALSDLAERQISTAGFADALARNGLPASTQHQASSPAPLPQDWSALKGICG